MKWAEEWNTSIKMTSRDRLNSGAFWDGRTNGVGSSNFSNDITADQLAIIRPEADQRILEIGPGNGRLTIPLARSSSEVTVVDPSAIMLRLLMERSGHEGLTNLRPINDYWEHIDLEKLGRHHKLVSSFSLFMYDVEEQIRRMDSISDAVFLFVPAEIRIPFSVQEIMFDRIVVEHTDHEILSNITKDMGLRPHTSIIEYPEAPSFDSLDAAMTHCLDLYNAQGPAKEQVIEYLSSIIKMKDGRYSSSVSRKVGAIWWQKG